jgi:hypothetical protein
MREITLAVTVCLIIAANAFAVTGGFGGYYFLGVPMGDAKITGSTVSIMGLSASADYDMTDGYPFKMGPANFAMGGIVYFVPMFAVEGGFEMHTGYKNKEATIKGTYTYEGETGPFEYDEKEDNLTWKMNNIYAGARYTYPTAAGIIPIGCAGLLISMSKIEYADEFWGDPLEKDLIASAMHTGLYFGGGMNFFVTSHVGITALFKYNVLFEGTYDHEGYDDYVGIPGIELEEKWKPSPYVTTAFGIEYSI